MLLFLPLLETTVPITKHPSSNVRSRLHFQAKYNVRRCSKDWAEGGGVFLYLQRGAHATHITSSLQELASMLRLFAELDPRMLNRVLALTDDGVALFSSSVALDLVPQPRACAVKLRFSVEVMEVVIGHGTTGSSDVSSR